jgi:hypothetical protein
MPIWGPYLIDYEVSTGPRLGICDWQKSILFYPRELAIELCI